MNGELILNFGSGSDVAADEFGVDIIPNLGVSVICDFEHTYLPFRSASVDRIRTNHCLEHLDNIVGLMEEMHRILKPNGELDIVVPHFGAIGFWRDPTHKRPFTYCTFDYFVRGRKPVAYTPVEFEYIAQKLRFGSGLRAAIGRCICAMATRTWEKYYRTTFPALELHISLRKLSR